jgi:hypothetical protein
MSWSAYVDNYCERLAPGLWGEPLNAVTNAAFVLAALWVWRRWRGWRGNSAWDLNCLLIGLGLIGLASFTFHTVATRWAGALDSFFIALYLLFYLSVYARRALGLRWRFAWLGAPAFVVMAGFFNLLWGQLAIAVTSAETFGFTNQQAAFLTGMAKSGYLSAWSVLLVVTIHSAFKHREMTTPLASAAAVFLISLTLRQLDLPMCSQWPWGTHFVWHVLNAVTLGFTAEAMARRVNTINRTNLKQ